MNADNKPKRGFEPTPSFVIRTPLLPYGRFVDWAHGVTGAGAPTSDLPRALHNDCEQLRARLRALVATPEVADAIFVASPNLSDALPLWLDAPDSPRGHKVERALVRYVSRMAARATPFGLFSGVSAGWIADKTNLEVGARGEYQRHTRLDNDYLFALAEALGKVPAVRATLRYRANTSMYRTSEKVRYAQARLTGTLRSHHLVAAEATDYLLRTLERAAHGATPESLAQQLVVDDPDIKPAEARAYVHELIDSQILTSHLGPAVTGSDPIAGMVACLRDPSTASVHADMLDATRAGIAAIDASGLGVDSERYRDIARTLGSLPTKVELSRLFQVDMVKPAPQATLGDAVIDEMTRGIEVLRSITAIQPEDALDRFREAFSARYQDREAPLFEALDEESGIGFATSQVPGADASPLLAGLAFPSGDDDTEPVEWGPRRIHLQRRLHDALAEGRTELALTRDDLERLKPTRSAALPDTFSCMSTVLASSPEALASGDFRILLPSAGGPSGAKLSGRFCHASKAIEHGVRNHLRAEEALYPDAVFAEVAHLPEGRIGNILCRPVLRDYEIAYLGISGAPQDRVLSIDDLMVSVQAGRVVLRSCRLDREVIPRLTTAHNFWLRSVGIYRFLCSLQHQNGRGVGWSWGPLADAPFLPRVTCGKLIFARASWTLTDVDLKPLATSARGASKASTAEQVQTIRTRVFAAAQALRNRRQLPRRFVLADGDNELLVDLDNALSVDSFVHLVKSRSQCTLHEELPTTEDMVACGPEGRFSHELVVSFVKNREPAARPLRNKSKHMVTRRQAPGSGWLYAKLYTGAADADDVLRQVVHPLAHEAIKTGAASQWFFIRYGDPDWHLHVRFAGDPQVLHESVAPQLFGAAQSLVDKGLVWRVQLDTYEREMERYGGPRGIEPAEQIFWADSEAVAGIVDLLSGDAGMDARWRLAVRGTDMLLDDLGLNLEHKRNLMRLARRSMGEEFRVDARFGKQLGARWRTERAELISMLARDQSIDADHDLQPGFALFDRRSTRIRPIVGQLLQRETAGELTSSMYDMAWSYVHMHNNRLLRSAARAQELVIYDFLKRYYEERFAKADHAERHTP